MASPGRVFAVSSVVFFSAVFYILFRFPESTNLKVIVASLSIFWCAVLITLIAAQKLSELLGELELDAKWAWQNVLSSEISENFQPLVRVLSNYSEVSLAARNLIVSKGRRPVFLNARVVFLGAAGNQSEKSRRDAMAVELSEDTERTPAQVYQGAVEELMSSQTPVFRIVGLLSEDEFRSRSREKRAQYLSWLRHQVGQLKKNHNYVIFDNRRAPLWGASGASIFSSDGFLQQTGVSGDALFLKDAWVSRKLMQAVMRELRGARPENKLAFSQAEDTELRETTEIGLVGEKMSVMSLEDRMLKLEEIL